MNGSDPTPARIRRPGVGSDVHLLDESPRLGWTVAPLVPVAGSTPRPSPRQELVVPDRTRVVPTGAPIRRESRSFGIMSTFPPTACGIATFSAALAAGLVGN